MRCSETNQARDLPFVPHAKENGRQQGTQLPANFLILSRSLSAAVFRDVSGLGTLGALNDLKFDCISLLQGSVPIAHDRRIVHKHVRPVLTTDESIPLGIIKPLYVSFHFAWPPNYAFG